MSDKYQLIISVDRDKLSKEEVMELLKIKYPEATHIKRIKDYLTLQQMRSVRKWARQMSDELNDKHITVNQALREKGIEMQWTPELFLDLLWRPVQLSMFKEKSTKELKKIGEIDFIVDAITLFLTEKFDGEVNVYPFPSEKELFIKNSIDN